MAKQIRYGMVGGGMKALIGEVHRKALKFDNRVELVACCFSSHADRNADDNSDGDADCNAYGNPDGNAYGHTDRNAHGCPYCNPDGYA